jgi:hypothetical protein
MSCVKCGDVCKCISFESTDGSIVVTKKGTAFGCTFDIKQNGDALYILEFDDNTRRLCIKNTKGVEIDCVTIPDATQALSLQGNVLSITGGNSVTLPDLPDLNINSSSIRVQQGGPGGLNVLLEVEPSTDADNAIILGSDGKLYAPTTEQTNTFDAPVTFNAAVTANAPALFSAFEATGDATLKKTTLTDLQATGTSEFNDVTVNGQFGINQGGVVVYPDVYRGDYNTSTLYFLNNIVTYGNQLWVYYATSASSGHTPVDGSTYWKLYDTSTGTPGADGKSTELRFAVNGSSTAAPAIVNTDVNPAGWVLDPPVVGEAQYLWMTKAVKDSTGNLVGTWSTPVRLSGLVGPPGSQGTSSNLPFKETIFKRSSTVPATPTGGSWNTPVPSGWSDGIPAGSLQLFESTRIFTNDGASPQQAAWTTPVAVTDTAYVDYEFSSVATSPGTPTTVPANWHDTGTEDDIWQAIRITKNGVQGPWQVVKIKGENGEDGAPGIQGELGPAGPFLSYAGNWQSDVAYYGSADRITAVFYNDNYYVTRTDAGGNIPVGVVPINTVYWNAIQGNYESIATGLLLAQVAYINNLAVSFLRTGAPQAGVSGTEHIEIYPSFATLQGFRSQGEPGYDGLTDSDLHYLANSIIFFGINDDGARDEASVNSNMLSKYSALSGDPATVGTDQFNSDGTPITEAWNTGVAIRMNSGQYASVLSQQGYYVKDTTSSKFFSTLTSHYLVTPSAVIQNTLSAGNLNSRTITQPALMFGGKTFLIAHSGNGGLQAAGYYLQASSPNNIIIQNDTGSGETDVAPVVLIRNYSYNNTPVTDPIGGSTLYTFYCPTPGQVYRIVSSIAGASLSLDTDVNIYRKDGSTATTSITLNAGESITIMATTPSSGSLTGTAFIEL